jgi:hypothetical protein
MECDIVFQYTENDTKLILQGSKRKSKRIWNINKYSYEPDAVH